MKMYMKKHSSTTLDLNGSAGFPLREIVFGALWIGGLVGLNTSLDAIEKRKIFPLPRDKPLTLQSVAYATMTEVTLLFTYV
jgi:hypothetical protein